jgi:hypothetical protein
MTPYKIDIFYVDLKSKMAATTGQFNVGFYEENVLEK